MARGPEGLFMSRRFIVAVAAAVALLSSWTIRSAQAQDTVGHTDGAILSMPLLSAAVAPAVQPDAVQPALAPHVDFRPSGSHPSFMVPLYASTAALQVLDIHSTLSGLSRGAVEGNPLLSGVASHRAAFIGLKAAVAAGTIYAASRLAKHNKIAAVVTLVALDSAYAFVVSHNYRLAHGQ
jgi:Domain of unknown function (DUF5658)